MHHFPKIGFSTTTSGSLLLATIGSTGSMQSSTCIPFSTNGFCAGLVPFHPLFRLAFVSLTKMGRLGVRWTSSITDTFSGKNENQRQHISNFRKIPKISYFECRKSGTSRKIGSPLQVQIHYTNQPIVGWHLIISNHPILETYRPTAWKIGVAGVKIN